MLYVISKLILFSPENVSEEVYWALAGIYMLLWFVTIFSVLSKRKTVPARLAWFMLITFLPVLGIAAHCITCLIGADYQFLKQFGVGSSKSTASFQATSLSSRNTSSQPSS